MKPMLFRRMQQELRTEGLLDASNAAGVLTLLGEALAFTALTFGLLRAPLWSLSYWLLVLVGGVLLFRWFAILHECGHKTLFRQRWANTAAGHVASVFCLIPYFAWRNVHLLHHRWVGVIDKDPTQCGLLKLREASDATNGAFRLLWKLWLPVPFAKFLFEVFWLYPFERARRSDAKNLRLGCFSDAVCAVPHAAFIGIFGWHPWAVHFLPMLVVFYFLIENMNLPQHSELFPYLSDAHPDPIMFAEQDAITRSTHLPDWLSALLALNFNRHTEHHLFPAAPWHALNKVRARLMDAGYQHPHEVKFLSFMWRLRRRDPLTIYRDALPHPAKNDHG